MLHVITSNPIDIKHMKQYANNFVFTHTYSRLTIPSMNNSEFVFDVYHQEGMGLDEYEDYKSGNGFCYNFIEGIQPITIVESIAESIHGMELKAKAEDPDDNPEEHMVAFACGYQWNQSAVKVFNRWMKEHDSEITAVNLYQVLKAPSRDKLVEYVKMALSTEYVYPDDPVAFGYAVYQTLNGMVR